MDQEKKALLRGSLLNSISSSEESISSHFKNRIKDFKDQKKKTTDKKKREEIQIKIKEAEEELAEIEKREKEAKQVALDKEKRTGKKKIVPWQEKLIKIKYFSGEGIKTIAELERTVNWLEEQRDNFINEDDLGVEYKKTIGVLKQIDTFLSENPEIKIARKGQKVEVISVTEKLETKELETLDKAIEKKDIPKVEKTEKTIDEDFVKEPTSEKAVDIEKIEGRLFSIPERNGCFRMEKEIKEKDRAFYKIDKEGNVYLMDKGEEVIRCINQYEYYLKPAFDIKNTWDANKSKGYIVKKLAKIDLETGQVIDKGIIIFTQEKGVKYELDSETINTKEKDIPVIKPATTEPEKDNETEPEVNAPKTTEAKSEKIKKFGYFDGGDKTNFEEIDPNIFSYNPENGEVTVLKEGWEFAKTNLGMYIDKAFNRLIVGKDLETEFENLDITPAIIDKNGKIITKGKIEKKNITKTVETEASKDSDLPWPEKLAKSVRYLGGEGINTIDKLQQKVTWFEEDVIPYFIKTKDFGPAYQEKMEVLKKIYEFLSENPELPIITNKLMAEAALGLEKLNTKELETLDKAIEGKETTDKDFVIEPIDVEPAKVEVPDTAGQETKISTTEFEAKKVDIERRRQEELKKDVDGYEYETNYRPDVAKKYGEVMESWVKAKDSIQYENEEERTRRTNTLIDAIKKYKEINIKYDTELAELEKQAKESGIEPEKVVPPTNTEEAEEQKPETEEKGISQAQQLRNAQNQLDLIKRNEKNVKELTDIFIGIGYNPSDAKEIAELTDLINNDEKRVKIYIENPKIKNGQIKLDTISKQLEENKEKLQKMMEEKAPITPLPPDTKPSWLSSKWAKVKGLFSKKTPDGIPMIPAPITPDAANTASSTPITPDAPIAPTNPPAIPLTPEEIELKKIFDKKDEEFATNLENSKYKKKILDSLKSWEYCGKNEDGTNQEEFKGFAKRFGKTAINLSLICGASLASTEILSHFGGAAVSHVGLTIAKRMGMGLSFGVLSSSNLSPEKKKYIMYSSIALLTVSMPFIAGGLTTAAALAAGTASLFSAASVAVGWAASKYVGDKWTEEKIIEHQKNATDKLLEKIKNGTIENDTAKIEKEYEKILKHYENARIYGKLLDQVKKLVTGTIVATGMVEVSGAMHAHQEKVELQKDIAHMKADHEHNLEKLDKMADDHKHFQDEQTARLEKIEHDRLDAIAKAEAEAKVEAEMKAELKHEAEVKAEQEAQAKIDAEALKVKTELEYKTETGAGAGETKPETKIESGDGKINIDGKILNPNTQTINIDGKVLTPDTQTINIDGTTVHPAPENMTPEMKAEMEAQANLNAQVEAQLKAELETPSQNVEVNVAPEHTLQYEQHQIDLHNQALHTEAETQVQGEMRAEASTNGDNNSLSNDTNTQAHQAEYNQRVEAQYQENLHNAELAELRHQAEIQVASEVRAESINHGGYDMGGSQSESNDIAGGSPISQAEYNQRVEAQYQENLHSAELKAGVEAKIQENIDSNIKNENDIQTKNEEAQITQIQNEIKLELETKAQYETAVNKMFPDQRSQELWNSIKNSTEGQSAEKLLHRDLDETNETFKPLVKMIDNIHHITHLDPIEGNALVSAESPQEYVMRGFRALIEMGKIDKLKL